jgi:hypothetical protein
MGHAQRLPDHQPVDDSTRWYGRSNYYGSDHMAVTVGPGDTEPGEGPC